MMTFRFRNIEEIKNFINEYWTEKDEIKHERRKEIRKKFYEPILQSDENIKENHCDYFKEICTCCDNEANIEKLANEIYKKCIHSKEDMESILNLCELDEKDVKYKNNKIIPNKEYYISIINEFDKKQPIEIHCPCKISKGLFSSQRCFFIKLSDGEIYKGMTDFNYFMDGNKKNLSDKQLEEGLIIDGYIKVILIDIFSNFQKYELYISPPDENDEILKVSGKYIDDSENNEIISRNKRDYNNEFNEITKTPFYIWKGEKINNDILISKTEEILDESVLVDYDEDDNLVGVEVLNKDKFLEYLSICFKKDFNL